MSLAVSRVQYSLNSWGLIVLPRKLIMALRLKDCEVVGLKTVHKRSVYGLMGAVMFDVWTAQSGRTKQVCGHMKPLRPTLPFTSLLVLIVILKSWNSIVWFLYIALHESNPTVALSPLYKVPARPLLSLWMDAWMNVSITAVQHADSLQPLLPPGMSPRHRPGATVAAPAVTRSSFDERNINSCPGGVVREGPVRVFLCAGVLCVRTFVPQMQDEVAESQVTS